MSHYKAVLTTLLLAVTFFIPTILNFAWAAIHYTGFMKTTLDITETVRTEGGVSPTVQSYVDYLKDKNYTITFTDAKSGQPINSTVEVGTTIDIHYTYKFTDFSKERTVKTTNDVFVLKR